MSELYVHTGKLSGIFSTFVPGITAESLLKRLYHALYNQRSDISDLSEVVQKQTTISFLTRNIATTHRRHAQEWFKEEYQHLKLKSEEEIVEGNMGLHLNNPQEESDSSQKRKADERSNDAIIQFVHYCFYVMAIMPDPYISYVSLYPDDSHWKMAHEIIVKKRELGEQFRPIEISELIELWKPMPSRKGSQYVVHLTPLGRQWVLENLVISVINGKITVKTNEEHGNAQKRREKSPAQQNKHSVIIIGDSRQDMNDSSKRLVDLTKRRLDLPSDHLSVKRMKADFEEKESLSWTEELVARIATSLESAVIANDEHADSSSIFSGQKLMQILHNYAPYTFSKLNDFMVLSQFSGVDDNLNNVDDPKQTIDLNSVAGMLPDDHHHGVPLPIKDSNDDDRDHNEDDEDDEENGEE